MVNQQRYIAFRVIFSPKGTYKVEFKYSPLSFKIGMLISLLTIILLVISGSISELVAKISIEIKGSRIQRVKGSAKRFESLNPFSQFF